MTAVTSAESNNKSGRSSAYFAYFHPNGATYILWLAGIINIYTICLYTSVLKFH
jgi:hypothetical protein